MQISNVQGRNPQSHNNGLFCSEKLSVWSYTWIPLRNKQNSFNSCLHFEQENITIERNNHILSNFTLDPCYKISFDINLQSLAQEVSEYYSILKGMNKFSAGLESGDWWHCSQNFPSVYASYIYETDEMTQMTYKNDTHLYLDFGFCINEEIHWPYSVIEYNRLYNIEVGQKYNSSGRDRNNLIIEIRTDFECTPGGT